jgi:hypothetical protein
VQASGKGLVVDRGPCHEQAFNLNLQASQLQGRAQVDSSFSYTVQTQVALSTSGKGST